MHHTDIVCLQGFDPEGLGEGLATTLSQDGYGFALARSGGETNAIFWDRSRWECGATRTAGAALAVDLRLLDDVAVAVRVLCLRARLMGCELAALLGAAQTMPLLVAADFSELGGPEGALALPELAVCASASRAVLGEEVATPVAAAASAPRPVGLNALRTPDGMLFWSLEPVAVLSGHTEGYLATMVAEEIERQFPAGRLPLVAAFDWRRPACAGGSLDDKGALAAAGKSVGRRIRI